MPSTRNYSVRGADGAIWSNRSKKLLRQTSGKGHYPLFNLYGKQRTVAPLCMGSI